MIARAFVLAICALGACGNKNAVAPPPPPASLELPTAIALARAPGAAVTIVPTSAKDAIDLKRDARTSLVLDRASVSAPYHCRQIDVGSGKVLRDVELGVIAQTGWDADTDATGMAFVRNEREVVFHDASVGRDPRAIVWTRRAPARVSRVVLAEDIVYVVSQDLVGEWIVHAIERHSGEARWARVVPATSLVLLPTEGGLAWVRDGVLSEVALERGVELWSWAFAHEPNHVRRLDGGDWLVSGGEIDTTRLHVDTTRRETPVRISGHARVLGFPSHEGIAIDANGQWTATTRADGSFELVVPVHGTLTFWSSAPWDARAQALERAAGTRHYVLGTYTSALDAERAAHDGLEIEIGGGTVPNRD